MSSFTRIACFPITKKSPGRGEHGAVYTKVHRPGEKPANETIKIKTFFSYVKPALKIYRLPPLIILSVL